MNTSDAILSRLNLPARVVHTLELEGVRDLNDWRRLGKRRFELFGITTTTAKKIDTAAGKARR